MTAFVVTAIALYTLDGLVQLIKVKTGDDRPHSAVVLAVTASINLAIAAWGLTLLVGAQ